MVKALNKKINFLDIETFHQNNVPHVKLKSLPKHTSLSSISHEKNIAVSIFLIEFL